MKNRKEIEMDINLQEITAVCEELKDTQARLKFELKQTEDQLDKYYSILENLLERSNVDSMSYGPYIWKYKTTVRRTFNQSLFKESHPDLYEEFKMPSESKKLEFKIYK